MPIAEVQSIREAPKSGYRLRSLFKISTLLLVVLLLVVSALTWNGISSIRVKTEKNLNDTMLTMLNIAHRSMLDWALDRQVDLQRFASSPSILSIVQQLSEVQRNGESLQGHQALQQFLHELEMMAHYQQYQEFYLISPEGINLAASQDGYLGKQNILFGLDDNLYVVLSGRNRIIFPVMFPEKNNVGSELVTPKVAMFIGAPVFDPQGNVIAAMLVQLDPSNEFSQLFALSRVGMSGETYVFNSDGRMITESRFLHQLHLSGLIPPGKTSSMLLDLKQWIPGMVAEGDASKEAWHPESVQKSNFNVKGYDGYRGSKVVGAWLWDDVYQIGIAFEMDYDEAYTFYTSSLRPLEFTYVVILLLTAFLAAVYLRDQKRAMQANIDLQREIDERFLIEKELREKERYLADITSTLGEGVCVVDSQLRVSFVNPEFESLMGWSREEVLGKGANEVFRSVLPDGSLMKKEQCKAYQAIKRGREYHGVEGLFLTKGGDTLPVLLTITAIHKDHKREGSVIAFQDISERKQAEMALQESERRLKDAQQLAHIGNWEWDTQANKLVWSDEIYRIFGLGLRKFEASYEAFLAAVHPDDRQMVDDATKSALEKQIPYQIDHRIVLPNGEVRIVHEEAQVLHEDHLPARMVGTVQDITEQKKIEQSLRLSEERFRTMFQIATVGVALLDMEGHPFMTNPALQQFTGYSGEELKAMHFANFTYPDDVDIDVHLFQQLIAGDIDEYRLEKRYIKKSGEVVWGSLGVSILRDEDGVPQSIIGIVEDITERKKAEEVLVYHSSIDSLSEVYNRRVFDERLEQEWRRAQRSANYLSLILVDIDYFKKYNDHYGHPQGDLCIKRVAKAIESVAKRPGDLVARYGGEEFAVLLPNTNVEGADEIAAKIRSVVESLKIAHEISPVAKWVTVSIGVSTSAVGDGVSAEQLLNLADQALYRAKNQGRNQVALA